MKRHKQKKQARKKDFFQPLVVTLHDENEKNSLDLLLTQEEFAAWVANPFSGLVFEGCDEEIVE